MDGSYAETSVKKKQSPLNMVIKVAMVTFTAIMLLIGTSLFGVFAMIFSGILIVACIIVFPYLKVEYEYVYCDGQLDFDKIYSGNKRKTALRIDFENVEMMAPVNSHSLDSYNHQQVKVADYTSGYPDTKVYAIILRKGELLTKILCEPSEKMLSMIKQKAMRKFSEY
ncbi:MAG: hypothetical protein IJY09_01430 [Lachnospiraceae bacterium]|nr:hypothetical protein [Lachnospiraceae bacterium]